MNWTHFLLWVAGLYTLYYLVIVLIEIARSNRGAAEQNNAQELTFSESVSPTQLQHELLAESASKSGSAAKPAKRQTEPEVLASGGVGITELFRLAKQDSIVYTQSVSF